MRFFLFGIKITLYGMLMIAAYVFNTTVCPAVNIQGVSPDVLPFLVAYVALHEQYAGGMAFGVALGIICDSLKSRYLGFYSLVYMCLAAGGGWVSERYLRKNILTGVIMGVVFFLFMNLPRYMLVYNLGFQEDLNGLLEIPLSLVYSIPFSLLFYPFIKLISRILPPETAEG